MTSVACQITSTLKVALVDCLTVTDRANCSEPRTPQQRRRRTSGKQTALTSTHGGLIKPSQVSNRSTCAPFIDSNPAASGRCMRAESAAEGGVGTAGLRRKAPALRKVVEKADNTHTDVLLT
ncbi:hypothetical protein CBL_03480 [Carabus blaptoides fortunei]